MKEPMNKRPMSRFNPIFLWITLWAAMLMAFTILIPGILVTKITINKDTALPVKPKIDQLAGEQPLLIPVYLTKEKKIETVPLEYYVRGVVAAEMPIEFDLEALKAQALAARTYILRRVEQRDFSNVPVEGAWVTDSIVHQVYLTVQELKTKWGILKYTENMDKLNEAVSETQGKIITFDGQPIVATFFSTSNGYTENSEDYWKEYIPYLRSVPSLWDTKISPEYKETVAFNYDDFLHKFKVSPNLALPVSSGNALLKIVSTTSGHRIKEVRIGTNTFTGREVREALALKSSQFSWEVKGNKIYITTYGNGHGVGMSQWGANGMAMEGAQSEDIIKYYYKGVQIEPYTLHS